jgi:predicted outer membrane protein
MIFDPRILAVVGLALLASFAAGYGTGYVKETRRCAAAAAAHTASQQTVSAITERVVTVTDNRAVVQLARDLDAAHKRADQLQQKINEARNATPPAPDCALSVGLRDAINRDLATAGGP